VCLEGEISRDWVVSASVESGSDSALARSPALNRSPARKGELLAFVALDVWRMLPPRTFHW
jgi:hypothetical protein